MNRFNSVILSQVRFCFQTADCRDSPYFFSKTKPVKFIEQELFGDSDDDQGVTEDEAAFFEEEQRACEIMEREVNGDG